MLILNKDQEKESYIYIERKLNKYTIEDFQLKLCHETWEPDFDGNNIGKIFNTFLNIFLRTHYSNFPLIQAKYKMNQNSWITLRIVTSSKNKRELYKELQNNNNNNNVILASYYRDYSKILSMVMRRAEKIEYNKLILNSLNKVTTTWGIINKKSGRNKNY